MTEASGIAADRLKSFIERIERLDEERQAIADDIKEVKAEAKSAGFDLKTLDAMLRRRKLTREERDEQDMLLETYEHAVQQALPLKEPEERDGRVKQATPDTEKDFGYAPDASEQVHVAGDDYSARVNAPVAPEPLAPPARTAPAVSASIAAVKQQMRAAQ